MPTVRVAPAELWELQPPFPTTLLRPQSASRQNVYAAAPGLHGENRTSGGLPRSRITQTVAG